MGWLRKKADPISDRAQSLTQEIAQLEAQIRRLNARLEEDQAQPRLRSTALPHGATLNHKSTPQFDVPAPSPSAAEPIFEEVEHDTLETSPDSVVTPNHYNELGVRKYDLPALWRRIQSHFHGPAATNPKLVSYLAAGGIQGLRPLRYEKRVARRRVIWLTVFLFLIGLGILLALHHH